MNPRPLLVMWIPFLFLLAGSRPATVGSAPNLLPAFPQNAADSSLAHNVQVVGHIGGSTRAVFVQNNRAYIGEGVRLTILDISNPMTPTLLGRSNPWADIVQGIHVAGNHAYVAAATAGLRIVDISNPANPVETGSFTLGPGESAYRVVVTGTLAYVTQWSGFWVIDVSNPAAPSKRGQYHAGAGPVWNLAITGNHLYLPASAYGGLQVVDVSNPSYPVRITTVPGVGGSPRDVTIIGNYAFAVAASGGFYVLDISEPYAPTVVGDYWFYGFERVVAAGNRVYLLSGGYEQLMAIDVADPMDIVRLGTFHSAQGASDLAITSGLAYVASGQAGLKMVDVSQMAVEQGYYYPHGNTQKLATSGLYAFVTLENHGLVIVDVSDPTAPQEISSYKPFSKGWVVDVVTATNYVYAVIQDQAYDYYLRVVDISSPAAPIERGSSDTLSGLSPTAVGVTGNYVYVIGSGGLRVLDVSDPTHPTQAASLPTIGADIAIAGRYAYVATVFSHRLQVLDIISPTAPIEVGFYQAGTGVDIRRVAISGDRAYMVEVEYNSSWRVEVLDISDPAHPALLGSLGDWDSIEDLALAGNWVVLAMGDEGLSIVDVSDVTHPTEAVLFPSWPANGVAVQGNQVYMAAGWKGFRVLDISRLSSPVQNRTFNLWPSDARTVAIAGNYAYLADYDNGLKILDVSNPAAPGQVSTLDTPGQTLDVALVGPYAYLADYGQGLLAADVSDPANPQPAGGLTTTFGINYAKRVAVYSDTAFVAASWYGMKAVDVSNPVSPTQVGQYQLDGDLWDVAVTDQHAYMAVGSGVSRGLHVLDITNPITPTLTGFYTACDVYDVALGGAYAYAAAGRYGLRVISTTNPFSPTETSAYAEAGSLDDVIAAGSHVYLVEDTGLRVMDMSNPQWPVEMSAYRVNTSGNTQDVIISGTQAFLATYSEGLQVVDLTDPRRPRQIGIYQPAGGAIGGMALRGNYAALYVTYSFTPTEVQIIDVSDPDDLHLVGVYTESVGRPLGAVGNLLYLQGDGGVELFIVDISNLAAPTLAGSYNAYGVYSSAEDMRIAGNYAYVAFGTYGLHVLDISSPAQPTKIGGVTRYTFDIAVAGNWLYLIGYSGSKEGLLVYDVSNPTQPQYIGFYETINPRGVAVGGIYAYVADYETGLHVVNISNPAALTQAGAFQPPKFISRVAVTGTLAFLTESNGYVRVVDVSDPTAPIQVGQYMLPEPDVTGAGESAGGMAAVGDDIYVADGAGGLYILRYTDGTVNYTHRLYLPLVMRD